MKNLSDYKGEKAIELWTEMLESVLDIMNDAKVKQIIQDGRENDEKIFKIIASIAKLHAKEINDILLMIDDTPVDAANFIRRLLENVSIIMGNGNMKSFFGFAEQETSSEESTGSVTENTGDGLN